MKPGVLATALLSLAVLDCAFADGDKDRALIEARWYTVAYVKEQLAASNPELLASTFNKNVTYVFSAETPGFQGKGPNLLVKKPTTTLQGDSIRWSPREKGKVLAAEVDAMCVHEIAKGLRSLRQQTLQSHMGVHPKGIVIAEIETGELIRAPANLSQTKSRKGEDIRIISPEGKGPLRCNVYRTQRRDSTDYNISVVFSAKAAYWKAK